MINKGANNLRAYKRFYYSGIYFNCLYILTLLGTFNYLKTFLIITEITINKKNFVKIFCTVL